MIAAARAEGASSLCQIAAALNKRRISAAGGIWSAAQIQRMLA